MLSRLPRPFPLLPRKKNADKSHYGHTLILAGSQSLTGAAVLASRAALESGSGLVTLGFPKGLKKINLRLLPEAMPLELPSTKSGSLDVGAFSKIQAFTKRRKINSLLIGPGLSLHPKTQALVRRLAAAVLIPMVLDADGINSFKGHPEKIKSHRAPLILTPHQKEFERLFNIPLPQSQIQRIKLAKKLSKFYDVVLVIKSHRTLVVYRDQYYENRTGNPGMSKGGSGDVLAGIIAAFIAQGLKPFLAACWGVYFHGLSADLAVKKRGELSLLASDIVNFLPKAFLCYQ